MKKFVILAGLILGFSTLSSVSLRHTTKNLAKASVMITNVSKTSGGTGVILSSTTYSSLILTNRHVCGLLDEAPGIVLTDDGHEHTIVSFVKAKSHDLCLIKVQEDLNVQSKIASAAPQTYDHARILGHPHLYPTMITEGYFSHKKAIQVMTSTKPCTEEDKNNPDTQVLCLFFGVVPVVESFESIVVSATIMAGSSGSPIYNDDGEIAGLVFAGEKDLSYAFAVPVEYIHQFLEVELPSALK